MQRNGPVVGHELLSAKIDLHFEAVCSSSRQLLGRESSSRTRVDAVVLPRVANAMARAMTA